LRNTINVEKVEGPYSPAILVSGSKQVYISGQVANDTNVDIRTQTNESLRKIERILESIDVFLSDIVKMTIFLTNFDDFKIVNEEFAKFYPSSPPACSTVQVAFLPLNAKVMIEAIAIRD
jgi:2-iminobutanoate/2-iminopropanoate deaminase